MQPELLRVNQLLAMGMAEPIDCVLHAQDVCMLSGPSGSGKSQFLKALADLIKHDGEVWLTEQTMQSFSAPDWRRQVMYFSAETAWWCDDVVAHFAHQPNATELAEVGLEQAILQANPDTLSSGEKQRLALLRGLQLLPKILLLDEITANLDPHSEQLVEARVQRYLQQQSAAAIWISHDPQQAQRLQTQSLVFSTGSGA